MCRCKFGTDSVRSEMAGCYEGHHDAVKEWAKLRQADGKYAGKMWPKQLEKGSLMHLNPSSVFWGG